MEYCARCLYPANAKPTIILDEEGVCSGCRYHESRGRLEVSWEERQRMLEQILDEARETARGGSKGLRLKNLRQVLGVSLVACPSQ